MDNFKHSAGDWLRDSEEGPINNQLFVLVQLLEDRLRSRGKHNTQFAYNRKLNTRCPRAGSLTESQNPRQLLSLTSRLRTFETRPLPTASLGSGEGATQVETPIRQGLRALHLQCSGLTLQYRITKVTVGA